MTDWPSEEKSQSQYSPGLVSNGEELLRVGYAPEHFDNGEVVVAAIRSDDLNEPQRRGFSVDRKEYADKSIIHERASVQMGRSPEQREVSFISRIPTGVLREQRTADGEKAFIVLDTALVDNIAHASIMSSKKRQRSQIKELKDILARFLQNRTLLSEYFASNEATPPPAAPSCLLNK